MNTINIKLYEIFKQDFNLSDTKAKELTQAVETVATEKANGVFDTYTSAIREDILKLDFKIEKLKSDLELKMEQNKTDLLKWFIGGFIALVAMIIGLYFKK